MLTETHDAISAGIQQSDRLVDVVSASCLLAFYYYVNGQVVEGYRHSFTAVRLAITLGLHQLCTDAYNSSDMYAPIPPVQDIAELRDRIAVFWQVYFLDRAWSVANQLPTALPDVVSSELLKIRTPWPQKIQSLVSLSLRISYRTLWSIRLAPFAARKQPHILVFRGARQQTVYARASSRGCCIIRASISLIHE